MIETSTRQIIPGTLHGRTERAIHLPGPTGGLERIAEGYQINTEGAVAIAAKPLFRGPEEDLFEGILRASKGKRFLILNAHPDDEIAKSGTTFRLINEYGMVPDIATVTLGEHGTHNGTTRVVSSEMMRGIREKEMLKAAAVIGASEVYYFGKPDGGVKASEDLVSGLAGLIRERKYELMLLVSGAEGEHSDHVNTFKAGMEARRVAASSENVEGSIQPPHFIPLVGEGQVMIVNPARFIHKVDTTPSAHLVQRHWDAHTSQLRDPRYENFFGSQWRHEAGLHGDGAQIAEAYRVTNGHLKNGQDLGLPPQYHPGQTVALPIILRV